MNKPKFQFSNVVIVKETFLEVAEIEDGETAKCCVCKGGFKIAVNYTVDYSTTIIGERVTK